MVRLILFIILGVSGLYGATISGFVFDDSTGERLAGANVFLQNTQRGAATNSNGYFVIPDLPPGRYVLVGHYIGYRTLKQKVTLLKGPERIDIRLVPAALEMRPITVLADSVVSGQELFLKPVSQIFIKPRHIGTIPQIIESDLLRTLTRLPGIVAVSDYSSELYVRGGTPDQNLYLLDGIQIYNPEHFFGVFSVFNTDAIKDVWISKGGFGARYGGRLSSVLHVTHLDGSRKRVKNKTSISLLSARTTLEVPLGTTGSLAGSVRRTYFDQTVARLKALRDENIPDYHFWDGHLRAFIDINKSNKLTLSFFNSSDDLDYAVGENPALREDLHYNWGNKTAGVNWSFIPHPAVYADFWLSCSRFRSAFDFLDFQENNGIRDYSFKYSFEYNYSQDLVIRAGGEHTRLAAWYDALFPAGHVDIQQDAGFDVFYAQALWRPGARAELEAGCRVNRFANQKTFFQPVPRLVLRFRLNERISFKAAAGSYRQYLFRVPRTFVSDIWALAGTDYRESRAAHYVGAVQVDLSGMELEVEAYFKDYDHLLFYDPFFYIDQRPAGYDSTGLPNYNRLGDLFSPGNGSSFGIEFLFRKQNGIVNGWASCALGRTQYSISAINNGRAFPPRHDRFATFNVTGNMDLRNAVRRVLGKKSAAHKSTWRLGAGFIYAAGQPVTTTSSVYVVRPLPDQDFYSGYELYPGQRNNFRLPPYIRLDLSLTWSRRIGRVTLQPFVQVYNVTDRKNVWFLQYRDDLVDGKIIQDIETFSMLPVLPSAGLSIIF